MTAERICDSLRIASLKAQDRLSPSLGLPIGDSGLGWARIATIITGRDHYSPQESSLLFLLCFFFVRVCSDSRRRLSLRLNRLMRRSFLDSCLGDLGLTNPPISQSFATDHLEELVMALLVFDAEC